MPAITATAAAMALARTGRPESDANRGLKEASGVGLGRPAAAFT
jgi:hypothetical protein